MSIISQFTLGTPSNYITFNSESGDYVIKASRRLATRRDIREFDMAVPDEAGITDWQTLVGKTHYYLEGKIYSETDEGRYSALDKIRSVINPMLAEDNSEADYGYIPLKWTQTEPRQLLMKPLYVDIDENRRSAFKPTFKALFKIKYPVVTSQSSTVTNFTPGSYGTGDGLAIPSAGLAVPAVGLSMGQNSGTSGGGAIINNGNFPSWPVITFIGPVTNPKLSNGTDYIQINTSIDEGEEINIQYDQDTLEINHSDGTDLTQYLDSGSTLFKVSPGSTQLSFTAQSIASPADCQVSLLDSWALS